MKNIIIVAGPNGAGKTSFANIYLPDERQRFVYINADEIAREPPYAPMRETGRNLQAGREMLARIDATTNVGLDLMFETTLATLVHAKKIPRWQSLRYRVSLIYLQLPDVEASIRRVSHRVAGGGHNIPEATIRRRFALSLEYLNDLYKPIVDEWYVWDSLEGDFRLAAAWDD